MFQFSHKPCFKSRLVSTFNLNLLEAFGILSNPGDNAV